jgi:hypothetical protein
VVKADPTLPEAEAVLSCDPVIRWILAKFYRNLGGNEGLYEDALQAGRIGALLAIRSWDGRTPFVFWLRSKVWGQLSHLIRSEHRLKVLSWDDLSLAAWFRDSNSSGNGRRVEAVFDIFEVRGVVPKPPAEPPNYLCLNCQDQPIEAVIRPRSGSSKFCRACARRLLRQAKAFGDKGACPTCGKIYRSISPSRRRPCETGCDS